MIDKRPALIAQCESTADVVAAVGYGVDQGLEIAVRAGGHGVTGAALSEGGLVVDLRRMNQAEVDPDGRTVKVGGGATGPTWTPPASRTDLPRRVDACRRPGSRV